MIRYIKKIQPLTEEQEDDLAMANWLFDSHYWVEFEKGYYKCKWCGNIHTSVMGIHKDFPICPQNPKLKDINV